MTVQIEINGKKVNVSEGSMIIEAADNNNIPIPRFCYHRKLSVAANCRMCLVEVEKARKPLPACATPVTEGMRVWTQSETARAAQKAVMEFLLINHPLDCPVCDQGGECELQDLSIGYGTDSSRFTESKTSVLDKNLGPLISTYMTRCIVCTRCVRFGEEIAGAKELGVIGRGAFSEVTTFIEKNVDSEVSGNVIDLCPVGALTNKPFKFKARSWEMKSYPSIAPHDCLGSNIAIHSRRGKALRVVPRQNEEINEVWISDRDRWSLEAVNSEERLTSPLIKQKGKWIEVEWEVAFGAIDKKLKQIIENHGANSIAGLVSPNCTVEEMYLAQKFVRGLGSNNIDHRLRQTDFRHQDKFPKYPNLEISISDIENQNSILLVGSNIRKEQPIASLKIRKAASNGADVFVVNPANFDYNFDVTNNILSNVEHISEHILGIAKACVEQASANIPASFKTLLKDINPNTLQTKIAEKLLSSENRLILIGSLIESESDYTNVIAASNVLAKIIHAKVGILQTGANTAGAWLTGCVPHRTIGGENIKNAGLNVDKIFENKLKAYFLFGIEPELDTSYGNLATNALKSAEHVVAFSSFKSRELEEVCDIILPIATFAETSGNFLNCAGKMQQFVGASNPCGNARPLWKVLRVLGSLFDIHDFSYNSTEEVIADFRAHIDNNFDAGGFEEFIPDLKSHKKAKHFARIAATPLYATDMLVRHSKPLQETNDAINQCKISINSKMAKELGVKEGKKVKISDDESEVITPIAINDNLLDHTIWIPQGIALTSLLKVNYNNLEVEKA